MEDKIYLRNADLEDREKRNRIFNPETGISEDGTMHDCVYRPWINQPKKEQTMTREEAIEGINDKLKDLKYYAKEMGKVLKSTNYFIDELERQAKKEEPRYLLQTDLTSENGVQYLSFDKKRREYFMGALMTSENVQQKFTDSEILKIESITRFAKLCEKIVLNDGIKI